LKEKKNRGRTRKFLEGGKTIKSGGGKGVGPSVLVHAILWESGSNFVKGKKRGGHWTGEISEGS